MRSLRSSERQPPHIIPQISRIAQFLSAACLPSITASIPTVASKLTGTAVPPEHAPCLDVSLTFTILNL